MDYNFLNGFYQHRLIKYYVALKFDKIFRVRSTSIILQKCSLG